MLLQEMQTLGIILDVTHLSDISFWEAMDHYDGPFIKLSYPEQIQIM